MAVSETKHPPAAGTALGLVVHGRTLSAVVFILTCAVAPSVARVVLRSGLVNKTQVVGFGTNEFNVVPGLGFFIFINTGGVPGSGGWQVTGLPTTASVPITFVEGLNLIGVPFSASPYTSGQFMTAINGAGGNVSLALSWDTTFQQFKTQVVGFGTNEFNIVSDLGFFIFVNTGGVPPSPFVP